MALSPTQQQSSVPVITALLSKQKETEPVQDQPQPRPRHRPRPSQFFNELYPIYELELHMNDISPTK